MVRTGAVTSSVFSDFRSNSDADIRDPDIRFFRALAQLGRSFPGVTKVLHSVVHGVTTKVVPRHKCTERRWADAPC